MVFKRASFPNPVLEKGALGFTPMQKKILQLSIIIVNWNTRDLLRACLESIYREVRNVSFEILVVDNASADSSAEMVRKEFSSVNLIENTVNAGFGRANNQAYRQSRGEYVMFLNPDTEIHNQAPEKMIDFMKAHAEAWLVGPRAVHPDGTLQVSWCYFPSLAMVWTNGVPLKEAMAMIPLFRKILKSDAIYTNAGYTLPQSISSRPVDYLLGQCLMTKRSVLEQVGVFDESIFMYEEEADLCYRIHQAGGQVWFVNEAEILHYERQSIKQLPNELKEEARWFIQARTHFFKKYKGWIALVLFHVMTVVSTFIKLILFSLAILIDAKKRDYLKRKRQYHAYIGLYYLQRMFGQ